MNEVRNVTAALMGDPPPARSAAGEPPTEHRPAPVTISAGALASGEPSRELWPAPMALAETTTETLRPISTMVFDPPLVLMPTPTEHPAIEWLEPTALLVDAKYQRDLSDTGRRLIRKIAENFDWRRFKPPIAAWTENGYEVIDGQHTALGAAMRSDLPVIPVLVILAPDLEDRAASFVAHNTDRQTFQPMQLHKARVVGGDPAALMVERVCGAAKIQLVRRYLSNHEWKPGESNSVTAIGALIRRRNPDMAVKLLQVLVAADLPPILRDEIRAVEFLFTDPRYSERLPPLPEGGVALAATINRLGKTVINEARVMSRHDKVPVWKSMAMIWIAKTKQRAPR
jgi:hypothetical protein